MDKKRKEIILFIGSLFVAVIFITSFVGSGNIFGGSGSQQPQQQNITGYFASGAVNVTVYSYPTDLSFTVTNSSLVNATNNLLIAMENNGSISTYNQLNGQFSVYLDGMDAYAFQRAVFDSVGANSVSMSAREFVSMPNVGNLYVGSQAIQVYFGSSKYPITPSELSPLNSTIMIQVNAIVALQNGAYRVYNNNVTLRSV